MGVKGPFKGSKGTLQIKRSSTEHFPVVLFIMLNTVIIHFKSNV